jgi:plasmid stabilization system protein ParE
MSYQIEILPQALSEIEDSFQWIADNISATTAELWYEDLLETFAPLNFSPIAVPLPLRLKNFSK